ncbi:RNA polymerase ECF-subfamily sigma factor [Kutzneria sp. 744]|nr:RNA polymerase ECF-subfamily sigma factor [Kutzneria sp. 744]
MDATFTVFYRTTVKPLFGFLLMQGATPLDAGDIVQDTMIKLYERWHSVECHNAWAYRVASKALVRKIAAVREHPVAELPMASTLLRDSGIDRWMELHDLAAPMTHLPARQRQVMAWTLSGFTPGEIAKELDMTADSVRAALCKARRSLKAWRESREGQQ